MSLRVDAEKMLGIMLEDPKGFGWQISVTNPDGVSNTTPLYGSAADISTMIDADTGLLVSGQRATVGLRISSLNIQGLGIPKAIENRNMKPWVITFLDINGVSSTFKVSASMPDRSAGVVVCELENYKK